MPRKGFEEMNKPQERNTQSGDSSISPRSQAQSPRHEALERVKNALHSHGLLMLSDAKLPSVLSLVVGAPVKGSWWGHPMGHLIYFISQELGDGPDVLETKLLSGKVTFVHRRLWSALLAVCRSRESWQLQGLPREELTLLEKVTEKGRISLDTLPTTQPEEVRNAARELERRLLVHGTEIHTEAGAHSKILESWDHWAKEVGFVDTARALASGRAELETIVHDLNIRFSASARLPWQ